MIGAYLLSHKKAGHRLNIHNIPHHEALKQRADLLYLSSPLGQDPVQICKFITVTYQIQINKLCEVVKKNPYNYLCLYVLRQ